MSTYTETKEAEEQYQRDIKLEKTEWKIVVQQREYITSDFRNPDTTEKCKEAMKIILKNHLPLTKEDMSQIFAELEKETENHKRKDEETQKEALLMQKQHNSPLKLLERYGPYLEIEEYRNEINQAFDSLKDNEAKKDAIDYISKSRKIATDTKALLITHLTTRLESKPNESPESFLKKTINLFRGH